jgi:murein L,D-transpeptidase YcbB/YkuD
VLDDPKSWPRDRLATAIADGDTQVIRIAQPPRVVLFYATAAFEPTTGTVRFAEDIYGHDARLMILLAADGEAARRRGGR